jgi:molybdopterin-biosynthesis enzyme MoeA-like protein
MIQDGKVRGFAMGHAIPVRTDYNAGEVRHEVVTAALLVIGGKSLSGRTKDQNISYIAEYLTAMGIDLKEVRMVGDEERAIIDALNALRHIFTYVLTTGGIGPTHGDITADCVAKAFGVTIDTDPRALAILHEWVETTGAEMNETHLRMTRIPKGADLILNKVSGRLASGSVM